MAEKHGIVTLNGNPLTLVGRELKIGDRLPNITLLNNDLQPVELASFAGKIVILSTVPSLDTPVCDTETRTFNKRAAELGDKVAILTVSMDLPFAQKRWCGAAGIDRVVTLSDHREAALGEAFGVLIKELRLLARTVFVVDPSGVVQYIQYVPEIAQEPDYDAVLTAVNNLM